MKITKFGHCCFLIEEQSTRIITDPGNWNEIPDELKNIDAIVITHEHDDHLHIGHIKTILEQNPNVKIIGNSSVKANLQEKEYDFELLEEGQTTQIKDIKITGYGNKHAQIHPDREAIQNTGFFFNNKLFYPGDSFTDPNSPVDILALPVAGPWMKISEAIDYALKLRPRITFPVHDGNLKSPGGEHFAPPAFLEPKGIKFIILELNKEYEL